MRRKPTLAAKSAQWEFAVQDADRYRILAQTPAGSRQDQQRTTALEHQGRSTVATAAASLEAARQQIKVLASAGD